jgi:hypothetical protein
MLKGGLKIHAKKLPYSLPKSTPLPTLGPRIFWIINRIGEVPKYGVGEGRRFI